MCEKEWRVYNEVSGLVNDEIKTGRIHNSTDNILNYLNSESRRL
jgi:hypothetical protein